MARLPAEEKPEELNMTPMIDVVFLLIIFFILASHFVRQETQMQLALPAAETGEQAELEERRRVLINVLPSGEILLGTVPVTLADLPKRLEQASQQAEGKLEVRIRSDRSAAYRTVEPILLASARAGVWKVSFAVITKSDER
jgi:biopolymer transport protein ExbD